MAKQVPFTLHVRVVPARPGKRFEYIRDLQKISQLVYDSVSAINGVQVAIPGGGQAQSFGATSLGGFSNYVNGCAVKPQFGENPAQLMLAGFYESNGSNAQPYSDKTVISGGSEQEGPGAHAYDDTPTSTIDNEVKTLKEAFETAITAALPDGVEYSIFRIEYSGIVYGQKGFHFPR